MSSSSPRAAFVRIEPGLVSAFQRYSLIEHWLNDSGHRCSSPCDQGMPGGDGRARDTQIGSMLLFHSLFFEVNTFVHCYYFNVIPLSCLLPSIHVDIQEWRERA